MHWILQKMIFFGSFIILVALITISIIRTKFRKRKKDGDK